MKVIANISALYEHNASARLLDALGAIYPEGRIRHYFQLDLPLDDTRTLQTLALLETAGWTAKTKGSREGFQQQEFLLRLRRIYASADLMGCNRLELKPPYLFERDIQSKPGNGRGEAWRETGGEPSADGELQLMRSFLRKDLEFASTRRGYVVPNHVKELLESFQLSHLTFRPTDLIRKYREPLDWKDQAQKWWELCSSLVLPPLSPAMDLRDRSGNPIQPGDLSNGCHRYEGFYVHPELHYRKSDLEKVEPFDIAWTYEGFSPSSEPDQRVLVVSQRFREICEQHVLRTDWVPVRINP